MQSPNLEQQLLAAKVCLADMVMNNIALQKQNAALAETLKSQALPEQETVDVEQSKKGKKA